MSASFRGPPAKADEFDSIDEKERMKPAERQEPESIASVCMFRRLLVSTRLCYLDAMRKTTPPTAHLLFGETLKPPAAQIVCSTTRSNPYVFTRLWPRRSGEIVAPYQYWRDHRPKDEGKQTSSSRVLYLCARPFPALLCRKTAQRPLDATPTLGGPLVL
jgi:hypothetical protein